MSNAIKRSVPLAIKYPLWYLFKSPQRKLGFGRSIAMELSALFALGSHILFSGYRQKLKPVSICTGIKNRTSNYLKFVLPSILKMEHQELVEISVFDCGSDDAAILEAEMRRQWKGKLVFVSENQSFARASAFNGAIMQSTNELFFATDADLSLPVDLVAQCNKYVTQKTAWFPVCFKLFENRPAIYSEQNGEWDKAGKGLFASTKKQFIKSGRYNTNYTQWGWEDVDLWISYFQHGKVPIRTRIKGLLHHWHPSLMVATEEPEHLKKFNILGR